MGFLESTGQHRYHFTLQLWSYMCKISQESKGWCRGRGGKQTRITLVRFGSPFSLFVVLQLKRMNERNECKLESPHYNWGFCLYVYEEVSPCFGNAHTQYILLKHKLHLGIAKVIIKVKKRSTPVWTIP